MHASFKTFAFFLWLLPLGGGERQLVYSTPGVSKDKIQCPAELLKVLPKSKAMLERVRIKANQEGLIGWPELPKIGYVKVFDNPLYDQIWSPDVAIWNLSKDRKRFSAILLMRELHAKPRPFPSDLEYLEAVFVSDAFGKTTVKKLGVKIHALYRSLFFNRSPTGFPESIELGDVWSFQDIHDEGGAPTCFVYTPSLGLARSGLVLETMKEHEMAVNAPDDQEELGDSGGHSDSCEGVFVEDFTIVRESDGYLWLESNSNLYVFDSGSISKEHRSMLKLKSKTNAVPAP